MYSFLAIIIILLLGCVSNTPKKMVANFGQDAKDLTNQTELTLKSIRQANFDNQVSIILVNPGDIGVDKALKTPPISPDSLALRVSLLREISKYGDALVVMASDEQAERIDQASRQLYASVSSLNNTIATTKKGENGPLKDSELQLIATVTNIAGRRFFERKRLKALSNAIETANPVIGEAVDLTVKEIENWSEILKLSLETQAKNLYKIAQSPDSKGHFEIREKLIRKALQLKDQSEAADKVFAQLKSALNALKDSHQKLVNTLKDDSDENIQNLLSMLSKLGSEISRIHAFHSSLVTNESE